MLFCLLLTHFKIHFFKNKNYKKSRQTNGFGLDQGPNCLKWLSADNKCRQLTFDTANSILARSETFNYTNVVNAFIVFPPRCVNWRCFLTYKCLHIKMSTWVTFEI